MPTESYRPYIYQPGFTYETGWDKYALKYATLLQPDTLYYLHKQVMYDYITRHILPRFQARELTVLDFNCGTGNDFPFWLQQAKKLVGTDGSAGMLNKACESYNEHIESGKLVLFQGQLEQLDAHTLNDEQYDVIYSITGGFSYINDSLLTEKLKVLKDKLAPGGVMITAHLNTFCLPETVTLLAKGKLKKAFLRFKKNIPLGSIGVMHLRNKQLLKKLFQTHFNDVEIRPLIAVAPPYQTDVVIKRDTFKKLLRIEDYCTERSLFNIWADQLIVTCRNV